MPLSDVEINIIRVVVDQYISENKPTPRALLLRDFRGAAIQALDTLANLSILKTVGGGAQFFLPRAIAFHYCGDDSKKQLALKSFEMAVQSLKRLQNKDLEHGRSQHHTVQEVIAEATQLTNPPQSVRAEMIRIGLYLATEFGLLESVQGNAELTEISRMSVSERALTIDSPTVFWDNHVLQSSRNIEANHPAPQRPAETREQSSRPSLIAPLQLNEVLTDQLGPQADALNAALAEEPAKASRIAIEAAVRAISDKPSEVDFLEFGDFARAITDLIRNPKTQTPLTIGIDGPWGTGKTTLMGMIKEIFDRDRAGSGERRGAHTVWFNAWKYDREESLWAALALEILSQARKQLSIYKRIELKLKLNWKRIEFARLVKDTLRTLFYPSAAIIVGLGYAYFWSHWVNTAVDFSKYAAIITSAGVLGFLSLAAKKIYSKVIEPFELNISEYVRTPEYKERLGFLDEFETDFKFVIQAVTDNGKNPLVVFIDDLDRCEPSKPVEVIEAINHLLDADSCVFVIGMDARTVAASVQAKYKDVHAILDGGESGTRITLGYQFLEKIIQIPFRLPRASEVLLTRLVSGNLRPQGRPSSDRQHSVVTAEQLIRANEEKGNSREQAVKSVQKLHPELSEDTLVEASRNLYARTFDDDEEVSKAICEALPFLEMNARKVKRFINLFRLSILIANRRGLLERRVIEIRRLASWLAIVIRWPDFGELATDRLFLTRLSQASMLLESTYGSHPPTTEQASTVLAPYMKDSRIRTFAGNRQLLILLRSFLGAHEKLEAIADRLRPYAELSEVTAPPQPQA